MNFGSTTGCTPLSLMMRFVTSSEGPLPHLCERWDQTRKRDAGEARKRAKLGPKAAEERTRNLGAHSHHCPSHLRGRGEWRAPPRRQLQAAPTPHPAVHSRRHLGARQGVRHKLWEPRKLFVTPKPSLDP
jgi:hypothetical protein